MFAISRTNPLLLTSLALIALFAACAPTTKQATYTPTSEENIPKEYIATQQVVEGTLVSGDYYDPCLEGSWTSPTSAVDSFVSSFNPLMKAVDGSLSLTFNSGAFHYFGTFILQISDPANKAMYLQAEAELDYSGTYLTTTPTGNPENKDSIIVFDITSSQAPPVVWEAYSNGQIIDIAGLGAAAPSSTFPLPETTTYRCGGTSLEMEIPVIDGQSTLSFVR
jgi:hypothetical protein